MTTSLADDLQALLQFQLSLMNLAGALRESSKDHSAEAKQLLELLEQRNRQ